MKKELLEMMLGVCVKTDSLYDTVEKMIKGIGEIDIENTPQVQIIKSTISTLSDIIGVVALLKEDIKDADKCLSFLIDTLNKEHDKLKGVK